MTQKYKNSLLPKGQEKILNYEETSKDLFQVFALYRMDHKIHYMGIGGQCGQSCPCCRASAFKSGVDNDGWFGACPICLSKK